MTRVSARPIRPPAPDNDQTDVGSWSYLSTPYTGRKVFRQPNWNAGLFDAHSSRRSVPFCSPELWAVVAFDDDQLGDRMRLSHLDVGLVSGGIVAGERCVIVGEFDLTNVARAALPLNGAEFAAAHHKAPAEFLKMAALPQCGLIALLIVNIDAPIPICLRHFLFLSC